MSIDITNIILNAGGNNIDPSRKDGPSGKAPADAADSTLRSEYESFIRKALETTDTDVKAVEDARQALETGELDTPENTRSAAENILESGI